jgi:hypothetical protein
MAIVEEIRIGKMGEHKTAFLIFRQLLFSVNSVLRLLATDSLTSEHFFMYYSMFILLGRRGGRDRRSERSGNSLSHHDGPRAPPSRQRVAVHGPRASSQAGRAGAHGEGTFKIFTFSLSLLFFSISI